jgi:uncharacterized membrane protein
MTPYLAVKFLHIAGALAMFAALGIEFAVLRGLARARSPGETRVALDGWRLNQRIGAVGALLAILPGAYLAWAAWGMPAWLAASLGALVAVALMHGVVTRRLFAVLERELAARVPSVEADRLLRRLMASYFARALLLVAIVALMAMKPGVLGASATLIAAGVLSAITGPWVRSRPAQRALSHTGKQPVVAIGDHARDR